MVELATHLTLNQKTSGSNPDLGTKTYGGHNLTVEWRSVNPFASVQLRLTTPDLTLTIYKSIM